MPKIGLDVGGVIITSGTSNRGDTSFDKGQHLNKPAVRGAVEAVQHLVEAYGVARVFIISKCGEATEAKTREWLWHHSFYSKTGFDPDNLNFCRTREAKTPIAVGLELTHFVDDRSDVLGYMSGHVPNRYLFGPQSSDVLTASATDCIHVPDWETCLRLLMKA